jgi:hypothetical protein
VRTAALRRLNRPTLRSAGSTLRGVARLAVQPGEELQRFQNGQVVLQGVGMRQVAQAAVIGRTGLAQRHAVPGDRTFGGRRQAGQQAQQAGLAAAIGPAQPDDLAALEREVEPAEKQPVAAATGKLAGR